MIVASDGHLTIKFLVYQDVGFAHVCRWTPLGSAVEAQYISARTRTPHPSTPPSRPRREMESTLPMLSKNALCSLDCGVLHVIQHVATRQRATIYCFPALLELLSFPHHDIRK